MTDKLAVLLIKQAKKPEDIFGAPLDLANIKEAYRQLAIVVHPDHAKVKDAEALFRKLTEFKDAAEATLNGPPPTKRHDGVLTKPVMFKTRRFNYSMTHEIGRGATCLIYEGVQVAKDGTTMQAIARVVRNPVDNDLMDNEFSAFKRFNEKLTTLVANGKDGEQAAIKFGMRIPRFVEQIKLKDGKDVRHVNIFVRKDKYRTGWHTIAEVQKTLPKGAPPAMCIFIWNRMLEGLTFAHGCGLLHNALTPNHMLIHLPTHVGNMIDWTASGPCGTPAPYRDDKYEHPAEAVSGVPSSNSDVFMAAKCMVPLFGSWIHEPEAAPIRAVLNRSLQPKAKFRLGASATHTELAAAAIRVFGPPKFQPFDLASLAMVTTQN